MVKSIISERFRGAVQRYAGGSQTEAVVAVVARWHKDATDATERFHSDFEGWSSGMQVKASGNRGKYGHQVAQRRDGAISERFRGLVQRYAGGIQTVAVGDMVARWHKDATDRFQSDFEGARNGEFTISTMEHLESSWQGDALQARVFFYSFSLKSIVSWSVGVDL